MADNVYYLNLDNLREEDDIPNDEEGFIWFVIGHPLVVEYELLEFMREYNAEQLDDNAYIVFGSKGIPHYK